MDTSQLTQTSKTEIRCVCVRVCVQPLSVHRCKCAPLCMRAHSLSVCKPSLRSPSWPAVPAGSGRASPASARPATCSGSWMWSRASRTRPVRPETYSACQNPKARRCSSASRPPRCPSTWHPTARAWGRRASGAAGMRRGEPKGMRSLARLMLLVAERYARLLAANTLDFPETQFHFSKPFNHWVIRGL